MKTLIHFFGALVLTLAMTVACFDGPISKNETAALPVFTKIENVSPELPSSFHQHLNDQIIASFQSGPSYDWMEAKSMILPSNGEWTAVYGVSETGEVNSKSGFVTQDVEIGGRLVTQSYLKTDNGTLILEPVKKENGVTQSIVRFTSGGESQSVGYVNHLDISDQNRLYYGWIYRAPIDLPNA